MKLRKSKNSNAAAAGGGGRTPRVDFNLEFQALKDTVWRLTCRVVSLESEISELKDKYGCSGESGRPLRNVANARSYQNQSQSGESSGSGLDPGELLSVEFNQNQDEDQNPQKYQDVNAEIMHSFSEMSSELEEPDLSNDSNYDPVKPEVEDTKIWNPSTTKTTKRRRETRLGPDGKREKEFQCPICQKMFTRHEHRQDHIRTHSGNSFSCITCGATFAYKNALRRHEKYRCHTKMTLEELTCPTCNKVFRARKNLSIHMRVHEKKLRPKIEAVGTSAQGTSVTIIAGDLVPQDPLTYSNNLNNNEVEDGHYDVVVNEVQEYKNVVVNEVQEYKNSQSLVVEPPSPTTTHHDVLSNRNVDFSDMMQL